MRKKHKLLYIHNGKLKPEKVAKNVIKKLTDTFVRNIRTKLPNYLRSSSAKHCHATEAIMSTIIPGEWWVREMNSFI